MIMVSILLKASVTATRMVVKAYDEFITRRAHEMKALVTSQGIENELETSVIRMSKGFTQHRMVRRHRHSGDS